MVMHNSKKVLLVEGRDDEGVISCIRRKSCPSLSFDVVPKHGIDKLLDAIPAEVDRPDRLSLGVVADADSDPSLRWQQLQKRFLEANIDFPDKPSKRGTIIPAAEPSPMVGVWIMPDNVSSGAMEDFVWKMIPKCDTIQPRARKYVAGIPCQDRRHRSGKEQTAILYSWLAVQRDPKRIGATICSDRLSVDGGCCQMFVRWLRELFRD